MELATGRRACSCSTAADRSSATRTGAPTGAASSSRPTAASATRSTWWTSRRHGQDAGLRLPVGRLRAALQPDGRQVVYVSRGPPRPTRASSWSTTCDGQGEGARGLARPELRPGLFARRLRARLRLEHHGRVRDLPAAPRGRQVLAGHVRARARAHPGLPARSPEGGCARSGSMEAAGKPPWGSVPATNASMRTPGVPGGAGPAAAVHRHEHDVAGDRRTPRSGLSFMASAQNSIQIGSAVRAAVLPAAQALLLLVEADPDPGRQRGLVADEPAVGEVVGGARLARDGPLERARARGRAALRPRRAAGSS